VGSQTLAPFTAGRHGRTLTPSGVTVTPVRVQGVAGVHVRRGRDAELESRLQAAFGLSLPRTPRCVASRGVTCVWAGPGRWLIEADDAALPAHLRASLGPTASVVDQSSSRVALDLAGARVCEVLAKGIPVDLREFRAGDVALTVVGHIDLMIRRLGDEPRFRLGVPRSFLASFRDWFDAAAAEFGYEVGSGD
jgi:sarcosine oxidase subunit gamma